MTKTETASHINIVLVTHTGFKMSFSIIIPTCGRDTLIRTIESLNPAGLDYAQDEVLICGDGCGDLWIPTLLNSHKLPGLYTHTLECTRDFGASQRNLSLAHAAKDWILYMDDDDWFAPGALTTIRAALPDRPRKDEENVHLFRMQQPNGRILWEDRVVRHGNVGTPMIVHRRWSQHSDLQPMPMWDGEYGHDYRFLLATIKAYGPEHYQYPPFCKPSECVIWHPEVIAMVGHVPKPGEHK